MIDPAHDLPIQQQAEALGISRSSVYYRAHPVSAVDLWLLAAPICCNCTTPEGLL